MKKDSIIKNAMILFVITLIAGTLLGFTSEATLDARTLQAEKRVTNALEAVFEGGVNKKEVINQEYDGYVKAVYSFAESEESTEMIGYAFQLDTLEGYGDVIQIMVGISLDGTITGIDIIKSTETPGLGAEADGDAFKDQFKGKLLEILTVVKGNNDGQNIDALGGATITSEAVTGAVNEAINYYDTYIKGAK